jgi:hypothetical protein
MTDGCMAFSEKIAGAVLTGQLETLHIPVFIMMMMMMMMMTTKQQQTTCHLLQVYLFQTMSLAVSSCSIDCVYHHKLSQSSVLQRRIFTSDVTLCGIQPPRVNGIANNWGDFHFTVTDSRLFYGLALCAVRQLSISKAQGGCYEQTQPATTRWKEYRQGATTSHRAATKV